VPIDAGAHGASVLWLVASACRTCKAQRGLAVISGGDTKGQQRERGGLKKQQHQAVLGWARTRRPRPPAALLIAARYSATARPRSRRAGAPTTAARPRADAHGDSTAQEYTHSTPHSIKSVLPLHSCAAAVLRLWPVAWLRGSTKYYSRGVLCWLLLRAGFLCPVWRQPQPQQQQ
jgi:hypothetical protein